jgi:nitric oxide reductase large subunit
VTFSAQDKNSKQGNLTFDSERKRIVKKLYYAALLYTILGLAGGLFYRTLTHANDFTGFTQLAVVHTHFLVLGMVFLLGAILFERVFALSQSKLFNWFFWTYNVGLLWTGAFLTFNGTNTVLGNTTSAAVAGMSGIGHILLTIALILFFLCLRSRLFAPQAEAAPRRQEEAAPRQAVTAQG